jgi:hypothetical protein
VRATNAKLVHDTGCCVGVDNEHLTSARAGDRVAREQPQARTPSVALFRGWFGAAQKRRESCNCRQESVSFARFCL